MAASLSGGGKGKGRYKPLAEINVTPLVDVMLVLLIVFMVAAPLMTVGIKVDLPRTSAAAMNQDNEPLTITVNAEGVIYLQETETDLAGLVSRLQAISQNNPERRIFVRGDKGVPYGRIMEVMGTITQGGFTKVALLAEQAMTAPAPAAGQTRQPAAPAPQRRPAGRN